MRLAFIAIILLSTTFSQAQLESLTPIPAPPAQPKMTGTLGQVPDSVWRTVFKSVQIIRQNSVHKVPDDVLLTSTLDGMLSAVDRHSRYLTPEEMQRFQMEKYGVYLGLGLKTRWQADKLCIHMVIANGPADTAGIKPGTCLLSVNEISATAENSEILSRLLTAPQPGQRVTLALAQSENQTRRVTLIAARVHMDTVDATIVASKIGLLRIHQFVATTVDEIKRHVAELEDHGIHGLIIDLRDNHGGLFREAVAAADLFLSAGTICAVHPRAPAHIEYYRADRHVIAQGIPMALLVNDQTASSAEVFTAALQQHKRAMVFGTKTLGKGSIQSVFPLPNGGGIKLTTALITNPRGELIDMHGVIPDQPMTDPNESVWLRHAVEWLQAQRK